jgi:hypothetical protein
MKFKRAIDKELNYWIKRFNRKAEKHGDLYWYEITPTHRVHSPISTILGLKYPHRTILVLDARKPMISVSARRGDKAIAMNTLLEKAVAVLPNANAGGHVPAAGAGLRKRDLPIFKARVLKLAGVA